MKFTRYIQNLFKKTSWACIFIGVLIGVSVEYIIYPSDDISSQIRSTNSNYKFINPLLECELGESISHELKSFKGDLVDYVNSIKENNRANFVSIYFRDLNNGPWFGINETEQFSPASLLKIPIAMSVFKRSEFGNILNNKINFLKNTDNTEPFFRQEQIVLGKTYTIGELVEHMLIYSDNEAKNLLLNIEDIGNIDETFSYLNVNLSENDVSISVKQYATFFRILFNASYLNHDNSEKMLSILSKVKFDKGLVAGVPVGTQVSHKFGERQGGGTDPEVQLHDCGIIYYPKHPYILCVMTRGYGFNELASVIADVSKFVYNSIDKQYTKD